IVWRSGYRSTCFRFRARTARGLECGGESRRFCFRLAMMKKAVAAPPQSKALRAKNTSDVAQHQAVFDAVLAVARDGGIVAADREVSEIRRRGYLDTVRDDAGVEHDARRDAAIVPDHA